MNRNTTAVTPLISPADIARESDAFPTLIGEDIILARACGSTETHAAGEMLFSVGQRPVDFFVIVSGRVEILDTSCETVRVIVQHGPGSMLGDINLFLGRPAIASCRVLETLEVIRLTVEQVRRLLVRSAVLNEKWINAILRRRELMDITGFEGLRVIGDRHDPATLRLREFMHRNGVAHRWIDSADSSHLDLINCMKPAVVDYPAIAWGHEVLLQNPTVRELATRIGIAHVIEDEVFDTVIIGSGPAGLGAAVYAASEGLRTLVLDRLGPGGQAGSSSRIENFVGFPAGISGRDLAMRSYVQALKFGATFSAPVSVMNVQRGADDLLSITTDDGSTIRTRTAIVATGVSYRNLRVRGLPELRGAGVYYSATQVEALLCEHQPVHIIGAGNSAGQAAMYLSRFSDHVNLIVRGGDLRKSMSSYLSERVEVNPRIHLRMHHELRAIEGVDQLEKVHLENTITGQTTIETSAGIFIFIGATPCTDFLGDEICKDAKGFLLAGAESANCGSWPLTTRQPCTLETSMPGLFVAGDCRSSTAKRVAFAVGDGALAVNCVHDYLGTYA
ncbi:MAG: FAD-dependent oxidoreductase [Verrucomicrobia bacterium]|nr:FAD-dependent oxidoreductase [Verrucomicrobiota bacterium]